MSIRNEIYNRLRPEIDYPGPITIDIMEMIEKRIDEKLEHVNEVLNDSRITIQGCQRMKGKKDAFEEMKEMLK